MSKRTSPYERELDSILASLPEQAGPADADQQPGGMQSPKKPTLLLHACCGPCSSYVIEYLAQYFAITIFYYNPNIHPRAEYERRLEELAGFLPRFPAAGGIQLVEAPYLPEDFYRATGVREETELQKEAEKGERCRRCYEFRMRAAWQYAADHAFDWFTTTLSISPFKDADKINAIGTALEQGQSRPRFLPSDFKKKGGFKRSLELSAEYGLYRQDYCGCVYSRENKKHPSPLV
ncbi:MAG: epoxyqueuosine reductase QueH [Treponema sp.]|nr:epoxyqueuosine reductase QueH [Treponema sp.]